MRLFLWFSSTVQNLNFQVKMTDQDSFSNRNRKWFLKSESQYLFCKRRAAARSLLFNHSSWKEMRCENLDARSTCQIISRLYILSKVPSWHFSRETTWSQDQEWHQSMSSCNTLCNFKMTSISIKVTLGFFITFTMGRYWKITKNIIISRQY